ncbi:hypothetical protein FGO68_gene10519 [Halteria grandinella]|uniref:Uncharacterized protein n=1 Tax=Halteria grandinella TaxID=5974 RepID=A0A8J8P5H8_HALGN|nr:hypothetical protein FGO68_gene10519 [Halteria grandinella]
MVFPLCLLLATFFGFFGISSPNPNVSASFLCVETSFSIAFRQFKAPWPRTFMIYLLQVVSACILCLLLYIRDMSQIPFLLQSMAIEFQRYFKSLWGFLQESWPITRN